jgi:hypothetical protein
VVAVVRSAGVVPISYSVFGRRQPRSQPARPSVVAEGWRAERRPTDGIELLGSALGPCRNGRVWASAVISGDRRFRGTAGHRLSSSGSWDDARGRFGLWSRGRDLSAAGHLRSRGHGPGLRRQRWCVPATQWFLFGAQDSDRLDPGGGPAGAGGGKVGGEQRASGDRQHRGGRYDWTGSNAELVGHQPPGPAAARNAKRHAEEGGEQREGVACQATVWETWPRRSRGS